MSKFTAYITILLMLLTASGCAINLPFNNRMSYISVLKAKRITSSKNIPIAIKWVPSDFPSRMDIQGSSGFVGAASQTRIPTGIALSNRIAEALDVAVGIDNDSDKVLTINVLFAESKFEYSAGITNITAGIDYGMCGVEVAFMYAGKVWIEKFAAEMSDDTIGGTSQTVVLENAWDNIAVQITKYVTNNILASNGIRPIDDIATIGNSYSNKFETIGLNLMGKGEYREAREFFEKILFFQPTNLMAFKNLGVCYNKINDFDKAIVSFNRAINLYAENSDLFTQRGVAYTGKKDLQKALQDFDKAIKLNRINGEAIFERAILYNNVNKNREKALLDLDTACSVGFERACHWQLDKY